MANPFHTGRVAFISGLGLLLSAICVKFCQIGKTAACTDGKIDSKAVKPAKILGWSEDALASLKHAFFCAPILAHPRFGLHFVLEMDASLKACLSQWDDEGKLRPVAFASHGLGGGGGAECNYPDFSSFKLELLALMWAVSEKFKAYTLGSHCTVYTDHNPLAHLKTANLGATEQRWVAQLALFDRFAVQVGEDQPMC